MFPGTPEVRENTRWAVAVKHNGPPLPPVDRVTLTPPVINAAANVTLKVSNASGQVVATLPEGNLKAGANTLTWNGKDANGNQLPDGTYNVSVTATGANGAAIANTTSMGVTVTGVGFQNGAVSIFSGSNSYNLSNVLEIDA